MAQAATGARGRFGSMTELNVQALYRQHSADLRLSLRRRGASAETAADLSHDAFVRVLTADGDLPIAYARAYLFRIARNLVIDLARRQRLAPVVSDPEALASIADDAPSAERALISRQELEILQAALNEAPKTHLEVFFARLDGMTFDQIASKLGVPRQTAFSRMVKVMAHLAAALQRAGA